MFTLRFRVRNPCCYKEGSRRCDQSRHHKRRTPGSFSHEDCSEQKTVVAGARKCCDADQRKEARLAGMEQGIARGSKRCPNGCGRYEQPADTAHAEGDDGRDQLRHEKKDTSPEEKLPIQQRVGYGKPGLQRARRVNHMEGGECNQAKQHTADKVLGDARSSPPIVTLLRFSQEREKQMRR